MILRTLVFLALGACGEHSDAPDAHDEHAEHEVHGAEEGAEPAHADEENHLRISEDVLRDLRITTATARSGAAQEQATVLGELQVDGSRYAEVGVSVPARVQHLLVDQGDLVSPGQALAELQSADLGLARAKLAQAQALVDQAQRDLDRKRSMSDGVVSPKEMEQAELALRSAKLEEGASRATLLSYGVGSSTEGGGVFQLRAPTGGVILERGAHLGERVDPEVTLFRLADLSQLWLVVHAFERDALRVSIGDEVEARLPALPNRVYEGQVSRVGKEVDPNSRTVPVRVDLHNPEGVLLPGMSATAQLTLQGEAGVVRVPGVALQRCEAGWCVFLPLSEREFEVRAVGRGRDLGSDVEVLSGLKEGEIVVVDGAFLLRAEAAKQAGGGDEHGH